MATGRGRLLRQYWLGLQALQAQQAPFPGRGAALWRAEQAAWCARASRFRKVPDVPSAAGCPAVRASPRKAQRSGRPAGCPGSLTRLPSEILLKIFSHLDAVSLLCIGCVSKRFYHLANDNLIWIKIYSAAFPPRKSSWKADPVEETAACTSLLAIGEKEAGYWKKEYIAKQIASVKRALARVLRPVNPYTGLPVKTKEALRISGLGWAIVLKEKSGKEYIMDHVDLSLNDTSVTIVWYGKNWPCVTALSTLDLCGVTPVFMDRYKISTRNGPRWYSLIAKYDVSHLTECTVIGCDRLVRIFCLSPGLLVGLWKRKEELAFVVASLHFHHLVERSTLGSNSLPYEPPPHSPVLDDNPGYGLHGYQLHVDMHSGGTSYLCGTFRNLFTRKEQIENGHIKLVVINVKNNREHLPLVGKIGLTWKTNIFDGFIKSCSIMDVTLLDEYRKPFWCVSSPVCMRPAASLPDGSNLLGQTYCVDHTDTEGDVHAELVWMEEPEEYFLVSLVLQLTVAKVNHWFGTSPVGLLSRKLSGLEELRGVRGWIRSEGPRSPHLKAL